ncbi:MAG: methyltransferase domain-containing protein [Thermoanaerobaculia bacterium]
MASEGLDSDTLSREQRDRALRDLERVHTWTLAGPAVLRAVRALALPPGGALRVADVGAGGCDLTDRVLRRLSRRTDLAACDRQLAHLLHARENGRARWHVVADARSLPFRDDSFSTSLSHLLWHHFDERGNRECLEEMLRVSEHGVAIVDLRPSMLARRFFPALARVLRMDTVAWEDGVTSLAAAWPLPRVRRVLPRHVRYALRRRFPFRWSLVIRKGTHKI